MTKFEKDLRFMARPKYMCHSSDGVTANFNDLATAQQWCLLRQGYVKARVAPGKYEIVFSARIQDRPGYPAKSLILP